MTSWQDLRDAAPDLAQRAEAAFTATTNAVLGTIRKDGSPRLSGIDPRFFDADLWIGSMANARKADDLLRDPRMALHCVPWESRTKDADGVSAGGSADAKLTGRAVDITDAATIQRVMGRHFDEVGLEDQPTEGNLFRIDVDQVTTVWVEDEKHLVIETWTPDKGVVRIARD